MIEAKALAIASLFAERMSSQELAQACLAHFQNILEADEQVAEGARDGSRRLAKARARVARSDLNRFLMRLGVRRLRPVGNGYLSACPACNARSAVLINPQGDSQCQECDWTGNVIDIVNETIALSEIARPS